MGGYGPAIAQGMMERADEIHADNKQKKDEEHARKISDLILERQELVNKIPTLQQNSPEYVDAHKTLQGINMDIADVYHPQKNPGAIAQFGHLLTDHLKITNPTDRLKKQTEQTQARTDAAGKETDRQITAAPLTAAQLNSQKMQEQIKQIQASDMSDEDKKAAVQKVFGINTKSNWQQFKNPDGTLSWYDVTNPDIIPPGATAVAKGSTTTAKENIDQYNEAVKKGYTGTFLQWQGEEQRKGKPSTALSNIYAAAYQRAYGIKPEEMTPEDLDYITRKIAYDRAIPQTTTANTLKQNFAEQWVPIQETNTKSPGGPAPMPPRGKPKNNTPPPSRAEVAAVDTPAPISPAANVPAPMGVPPAPAPAAAPAAAGAGSAAAAPPATPSSPDKPGATPAAAPPTNPRALKKEAETLDPRKTSGSRGADASIKVGNPIMAAPSKEYRDARQQYHAATSRQKQMHVFLKDALKPGPPNQQAMLGLLFNHIGMTQGAQKGARINQKSVDEAKASTPWIKAKVAEWFHQDQNGDYIFDGLKGGVNLTKEQMEQMVDLADEATKIFKDNLKTVEDTLNEGVSHPTKSRDTSETATPKATPPKGATHKKLYQGQWYYTDKDGKNLGKVE